MTAPGQAAPTTAADVLAMLQRHYQPENRPPAGIFAPEIESPDGRRRADLIWLPTTIAGGRGLVGHEIKVSRSDVLNELADPTKADPWAKFCDRWWLVVSDPALIDGLDIPDAWGIMAPPSGRRTRSVTVLRPAPRLEPVDRARGVEKLAAWMLYRHHNSEARLRREVDDLTRTVGYRDEQITKLRAATVGHRIHPGAVRVQKILDIIDAAAHSEQLWGSLDEQEIARVVLDVEHAKDAIRNARHVVDHIGQVLDDPMRRVRERIARVKTETPELAEASR